jgi:L-lysine 2,3-aminomutase
MITRTLASAQRPSWQQQWRDAFREPVALLQFLGLEHLQERVSGAATRQFPLRVPLAFAQRMQYGNPHDPLLRQVLPLVDEEHIVPGYSIDAVGDLQSKASKGVLHKYEGRALLISTGSCAVHCRYCFRRHFPYGEEAASANEWAEAIIHLQNDASIEEVLLSGGDPFSLSTEKLSTLTDSLRAIPHIKRLRIHTRLPIVLPDRVDAALLQWLQSLPWPVALVLHANHAQEFDLHVDDACRALRNTGVNLLNQAVLLAGVNDRLQSIKDLCERGYAAGVLPYYLHQLDRVHGAAHFAVSDEKALSLIDQLRDTLPGYLLPRLVREIPGERSKSPLIGPITPL